MLGPRVPVSSQPEVHAWPHPKASLPCSAADPAPARASRLSLSHHAAPTLWAPLLHRPARSSGLPLLWGHLTATTHCWSGAFAEAAAAGPARHSCRAGAPGNSLLPAPPPFPACPGASPTSPAPDPFPEVAFSHRPPCPPTLLLGTCLRLSPAAWPGALAPPSPSACHQTRQPWVPLPLSSSSPPGGLCPSGHLPHPSLARAASQPLSCVSTPVTGVRPLPACRRAKSCCATRSSQSTGSVARVVSVTAGPAWPRPPWGPRQTWCQEGGTGSQICSRSSVSVLPYTGRMTQTSLSGPRGLVCAGIASVSQQERGREGAS